VRGTIWKDFMSHAQAIRASMDGMVSTPELFDSRNEMMLHRDHDYIWMYIILISIEHSKRQDEYEGTFRSKSSTTGGVSLTRSQRCSGENMIRTSLASPG
jgi:hypothetical protein